MHPVCVTGQEFGLADTTSVDSGWLDLKEEYGERLLNQMKNRRWKELHNRYGEMFGMNYETFVSWGKWVVQGEPDAAVETPTSLYTSSRKTWYDEDRDTYTTFLPGFGLVELPGDVHRDIVRAYSDFDGTPASVNELARNFKLPRQWLVKYLRAHEITHDKEPFTPEEILNRPEDELIEEALQARRAALYTRLEREKWREIKKDADKWRAAEDHILRKITDAIGTKSPPAPNKLSLRVAKTPYAVVMGISDLHWGKYSDPGENFEPMNRELIRDRLFGVTEQIVGRLSNFGAPEKIYVPIGSDFLHIDTDQGTTTRGTQQDMDGTPAELLVSGCYMLADWIETLRQVAPVELVLMSGNHDRIAGLAILLYLSAYYKNALDVTVHMARTPRVYHAYGKNLIGFVHGDGVQKTRDIAGHMAREASSDWSSCPHKTVYTGHLHHEKTETDSAYGVTRRQLPSLSGPDRWHARLGYVGERKSLPAYLHDRDTGLVAVIHGVPKK